MSNQEVGGDRRTETPFERLMGWLRSVVGDDGAGMAEYALLLLLVAFAAISIFTTLAGAIQNAVTTWVSAFNAIN